MIGSSSTLLGMTVCESGIHIAQVRAERTGPRQTKLAFLRIPQSPGGAGWDKPQELGRELRNYLRGLGFGASQAIVGMPGRWLLAQSKPIPPAGLNTAVGILRLGIEREYQADARDWVFDFQGEPSTSQKSSLLLCATPHARLSQVAQMLKEAGVTPKAVTSTLLSLARFTPAPNQADDAVLYLSHDGVELAVRNSAQVVLAERFSPIQPSPTQETRGAGGGSGGDSGGGSVGGADPVRLVTLAAQIKRALAGVPGAAEPRVMTIWNDGVVDAKTLDALTQLIPNARLGSASADLGVGDGPILPGPVALALSGLGRRKPGVDFLKSKLVVDTGSRAMRTRYIALGAGALVVIGAAWFGADWYQQSREVEDLKAQLDSMKSDVAAAQANVDRLSLARGWYDSRPGFLDGVRALTLAFPNGGQVWATSVSLRDDLKGTVVGRAKNERGVIELLDRLRAGKRFTEVKLLYLRQADRTTKSVSFALTFTFTGQE